MTAWLIEYLGAIPCPIYVPADFNKSDGSYTLNAWDAKKFTTKEAAEKYMSDPDGCMPYGEPWAAVEHGFGTACLIL